MSIFKKVRIIECMIDKKQPKPEYYDINKSLIKSFTNDVQALGGTYQGTHGSFHFSPCTDEASVFDYAAVCGCHTDREVKDSVLCLLKAGLRVFLILDACKGAPEHADNEAHAIVEMSNEGAVISTSTSFIKQIQMIEGLVDVRKIVQKQLDKEDS